MKKTPDRKMQQRKKPPTLIISNRFQPPSQHMREAFARAMCTLTKPTKSNDN